MKRRGHEWTNQYAETISQAAIATQANRVGRFGQCSQPIDENGFLAIDVSELPKSSYFSVYSATLNAKAMLAYKLNNFKTLAFDLFARVCDQVVAGGSEPVWIKPVQNLTDTQSLSDFANGCIEASSAARVIMIGYKTPEEDYSIRRHTAWGASVIHFTNKQRLILGSKIKPGHKIVAFKEEGFRSTGVGLADEVFSCIKGFEWYTQKFYGGVSLGQAVLTPSKIVARAIVDLYGGFENGGVVKRKEVISNASQVVEGGLVRALRLLVGKKIYNEILPRYGADISDPFDAPPIMLYCLKMGRKTCTESYKKLGMGHGFIVSTPKSDEVLSVAESYGLEAKVIGEVIDVPEIRIKNKGVRKYDYLIKEIESHGVGLDKNLFSREFKILDDAKKDILTFDAYKTDDKKFH